MASRDGGASAAATTDGQTAAESLGSYQGDIGDYMSNVNSAIAAGNPYESKDYLTKQNLETSGAMNSENDAANENLQQTVARTGTNSAALANTEASNARQSQRDLTQYTAARDTANTDKWQDQEQRLYGDQLAGANSEAGVYGTALGGQTSNIKTTEDAEQAEEQMWAQLGSAAMSGAGAGLGGAFGG